MKEAALAYLAELVRRYPILAGQSERIARATEILIRGYRAGGKLLICGNGGSAADAEHIVGELMKGFRLARQVPAAGIAKLRATGYEDWAELARTLQRGLPALALTGHPALSTAVLNDNDPYMTFAQQVYILGQPGDIVLGLSTSGNSRNVVNALKVAHAFGLYTVGLCGQKGSLMDDVCDCIIHIPEEETFKVQELFLPVYHAVCLALEDEFFGMEVSPQPAENRS